MNLIIPGVGTESGPQYATEINNSLSIIDGHTHTAGSGVQITPSAININSNLTMNSNALTSSSYLNLSAQSVAPSSFLSLYASGRELYFEDGVGNQVQITNAGTVNVVSSGISSGTATASFVSGVLVVDSNTNTPANIKAGSILMGNIVANSPYLTLQPPTLSSNYTLTLPTIPAQTNVMTLDSSGNMGSTTYDAVGQNMTSVGANAIESSRTMANGPSPGVNGFAIAGPFTITASSSTPVQVPELTVTLVTSGRPVFVGLIGQNTSTAYVEINTSNALTTVYPYIEFVRDITTGFYQNVISLAFAPSFAASPGYARLPASAFSVFDIVNAGTHVYTVTIAASNAPPSSTLSLVNCYLVAYEL